MIQPNNFLATTNVWDPSQIAQMDPNSPEFKQFLVYMYQNINLISLAVNSKDSGDYNTMEYISGRRYFPNPALTSLTAAVPVSRSGIRKVIDFGALPNATSKSVAHNIPVSTKYTFVQIYGTATDPVALSGLPIPFASPTLNQNIKLEVDATNVTITTGIDRTAYTQCIVVLQYITM